jgi:glycosyltransferase involved in cell wall biosynthesis
MRLVLITRQFWPQVGGAQTALGLLSRALVELGHEVTLLTARWHPHWPERLQRDGVQVIRLPTSPVRMWGTWVYMRAIERWLREARGAYDLVYVSMLKHDAYAALAAADAPVVLRPEGAGETGDVRWQQTARFGRRIARRCREAPAVVAIAESVERELSAAGYPADRIHRIPNGVEIPAPIDSELRASARRTLAKADIKFRLPDGAPLAVYTGRLHAGKGLAELLTAFGVICKRRPEARLWIVGDGPQRSLLSAQIQQQGLARNVLLAGQFDSVQEFHQAADVVVLPSHEELMSLSLLESMAAGLPIVATEIPGNRNVVHHGQQALLYPPGDAERLAAALERVWSQPALAHRLSAAARERAAAEFSLASMAHRHVELFEQLIRSSNKK